MENRAHETRSNKGARIVENVRKWAHDHLTLQGREDALYRKKFAQVAEHLPKKITDSQLALIEMRLRQQAKSGAIGSIVMDVLVGGGALVGGGMLLNRLSEKRPFISPAQKNALRRVENRSKEAFKSVRDLSGGLVKAGADLTKFGLKVVTTPIRWGANIMFWPIRKVGQGGAYVWSLFGGPEAAQLAGYTVKNTLKAVPDTLKAVKGIVSNS